MCPVLKQRIRKHLLNASRQRRSSDDDDEDTLGFVGEIDAVSVSSSTHYCSISQHCVLITSVMCVNCFCATSNL